MADKRLWKRGILLIYRSHDAAAAAKTLMKRGTTRDRTERPETQPSVLTVEGSAREA
jgi:hypothetical protein